MYYNKQMTCNLKKTISIDYKQYNNVFKNKVSLTSRYVT